MKWAIDKIENSIATLENITTGEKKELSTFLLPPSIKEGTILVEKNNTYLKDPLEEETRRKEIELRFQRLRSKD